MQRYWVRFFLFLNAYLFATGAAAAYELNMPRGVSTISDEIYRLHMAAFYVCCGIGVVVFGVLLYSIIKFRKSKGAKAAHFHEHLGLEIFWTTVPFLILIALAVPATIVLAHIHNTDQSELTIKITGYQWKWKYEYLDQGIQFFSNLSTTQEQIHNSQPKDKWFLLEVDHPLVVPINTKIRLLVTADDVIHAWWVPDLGVKQDAIPGFINENWVYITKPGTYRGQCGELCGVYHGFMPIVVQAVTSEEFIQWTNTQRPGSPEGAKKALATLQPLSNDELMTLGKAQYEKSCVMCHQASGAGLPPTFPPLRHSHIVTGPADATIGFVLTGVPGTAMQAFGAQLNDKEIASVVTYIRHAWENENIVNKNKYPLTVQPSDVAKVRKAQK